MGFDSSEAVWSRAWSVDAESWTAIANSGQRARQGRGAHLEDRIGTVVPANWRDGPSGYRQPRSTSGERRQQQEEGSAGESWMMEE